MLGSLDNDRSAECATRVQSGGSHRVANALSPAV